MSLSELVDAVAPVVGVFERLGVKYYVGGSVASSAHGLPRTTIDADMVAELRPDHVILNKLEWYRIGEEVSERQWLDVLGVMKVQKNRLDDDYLRRWAAELNVLDLLQRALAEADIE